MKGSLAVRAPTCSGSGRHGLLPSSVIHAPCTRFEPKHLQAPASVPCLCAEAAAASTAQEKRAARYELAWYPGKEAKEVCGTDNVISAAQSSLGQEAMSPLPCLCTYLRVLLREPGLSTGPGGGKHLFSCVHAKKVWDPINNPSLLLVWKKPPAMIKLCSNLSLSLCFLET